MRGFGDYQKAQMKRHEPRIGEFFHHVRHAIDVLEQIVLNAREEALSTATSPIKIEKEDAEAELTKVDSGKLSYGIKEASQKTGLSRSSLYLAISTKQLRAVKCGSRTLIQVKDLKAWMDSWPAR